MLRRCAVIKGEVTTVYNLCVADFHTCFVGGEEWDFRVWAHNASSQRVSSTDDLAQK